MFLLDTNVISESTRRSPDTHVVQWLRGVEPTSLFISAMTLGEVAKGARMIAARDPGRQASLQRWLEGIKLNYAGRLLGIDATVAEAWGNLTAPRPLPVIDGLLAATALVHGLTLVTRNTRDFTGTDVAMFNPWEDWPL